MLLRNHIKIAGANVVVVGRSDIVGKPMAVMLMQRGAGADSSEDEESAPGEVVVEDNIGRLQRGGSFLSFVVNVGEVTALAGAMRVGAGSLLGVAMGSSEAGGYVTSDRLLTSWLNELAFVPIDRSPAAPRDDWSGDAGVGAQYLSQRAVARLLPAAGIETPRDMDQPAQLVELQRLMARGDARAASVYETIGVYLGYALLQYARFYRIDHLLLLGRVTSGAGGDLIQETARRVLQAEQDRSATQITFHAASERDKRHGQAVVAASLPRIA